MIIMYLILVYDIEQKRVSKVMKICREYLDHVQNSVFEGEITSAGFKEIQSRINGVIDKNADSVIIYELWKDNFKRNIIGVEKKEIDNFL